MKIGLFDSGIGGLTVLSRLIESYGGHEYVYFADYANLPYGSKEEKRLRNIVLHGVEFLIEQGVEVIVSACNTGDAVLDEQTKEELSVPYYSIVSAAARAASEYSKIGIITTDQTLKTGVYLKEVLKYNPMATIYQKSAPLFVQLVEEGVWEGKMVNAAVDYYLRDMKKWAPETVILGCTHYPFLMKAISKYLGKIELLDPAQFLVKELENVIPKSDEEGKITFFVTGNVEKFRTMIQRVKLKLLNSELHRQTSVNDFVHPVQLVDEMA
ncbi:MAG TPA: glutamate racemase [Thermotogae bacterium]|nr:glutamate racemase [Thermotogota bacterium]